MNTHVFVQGFKEREIREASLRTEIEQLTLETAKGSSQLRNCPLNNFFFF